MTIGKIQLDLGVNPSGFKQQLRGATKAAQTSTNAMSSMFGKLGKTIAAAFAVKKIAGFAKSCINLGSDLAEVQNVVDVTFGSMSDKVNDFAKNAMESYGLSEKVAKQYMGTYGAMSKAFGFTTEAAYEQAAALTGLAGDVASFYNLTTDEAYTKLKSVFTSETESLKDLGVVMTQTALDEFALQKGMGKTTSQMSEQEKVALRLAFVQDRLATASGDFARTSGGWANQTRVLSLRFDALKASIGQGLINVLLPIVRVLNEIIARLQVAADAFSNFTAAIFGKADTSSAVIESAAATGDLSENLSDGASSAKAIKKSLAGFDQLNLLGSSDSDSSGSGSSASGSSTGTTITPTVETPKIESGAAAKILEWIKTLPKLNFEVDWEYLKTNLVTGFANLWESVKDFANLALTISINVFNDLGIDTLITRLSELWVSFTNLTKVITDVVSPICIAFYDTAISPMVQWIGEKLADAVSTVKELFDDWADWFSTNAESIGAFAGTLGDIVENIWSFAEPLGDAIWETFKDVIKIISDIFQGLFQWIIDNQTAVVTALGAITAALTAYKAVLIVTTLIEAFKNGLNAATIATKASTIAQTALNAVMGANPIALVVAALAGLVAAFVVLWNTSEDFRNFWIGLWENIKTGATSACSGIKTAFSNIGPWFSEKAAAVKAAFSAIWSKLKTGASDAWKKVKETFSSIGTWFGEKITSVKDKFSSMWSKFKSGASDAWSSVKTTFSNIPTWFKDKFTDAWTKVKNVFSSGGKIFDGIKEGIGDAFKTVVNKLIDGINTVVAKPFNKINDMLTSIRNTSILGAKPFSWLGSISVPQIPKLATGAYVAANTPQLAIIGDNKHEGEIVAPESKIAEAVAAGVGAAMRQIAEILNARNSNSQAPIVIKIGERDVWEGFVDYHNSTVKRTGNSPLLI